MTQEKNSPMPEMKEKNGTLEREEKPENNLTISTKLSTEQLICKTPQESPNASVKSLKNEEFVKKKTNIADEAYPSLLYLGTSQILFGLLMAVFGVLVIVHDAKLAQVTRIFIRNLKISMTKDELIGLLQSILDINMIEKIYKKQNYSFIHFHTREMAEEGLEKLRDHFCGTDVEVTWSIPPSEAKKREENLPFRFKKDQKTKPIKCNCKHSKPVLICPCVNRHCEVPTRSQQVRALYGLKKTGTGLMLAIDSTSSEDKSRMTHSSSWSRNDVFHFDLPAKCIGNIFE